MGWQASGLAGARTWAGELVGGWIGGCGGGHGLVDWRVGGQADGRVGG